ncbi:MAG TPA: amidohydrolase family protein [Jatrophihabitans sp.]
MTATRASTEIDRGILRAMHDVDAHEMTPTHLWGEVFGPAMGRIGVLAEPIFRSVGKDNMVHPELAGDTAEITGVSVWETKGSVAPGAFDFTRRLAVLDQMGIERQLVFPTCVLTALWMIEGQNLQRFMDNDMSIEDVRELGWAGLREYNQWAIRFSDFGGGRLRPVAYLPQVDTPEALIAEARRFIDAGIRAVHLNVGRPPGGRSPAHPDLDPFWQLLATHNICCTVHVGGEVDFMSSSEWVNAPAFALGKAQSHEIGLEPYSFATLHLAQSNWLITMVLGGVFERHPALRLGMLEVGCAWLGPLADHLDMWARDVYASRLAPFISSAPSDYIARNVRVTAFNDFERPDEYILAHPKVAESICYSSDYPHVEGGKHSAERMFDRIAPLGAGVVQKFFRENATLLLPD